MFIHYFLVTIVFSAVEKRKLLLSCEKNRCVEEDFFNNLFTCIIHIDCVVK